MNTEAVAEVMNTSAPYGLAAGAARERCDGTALVIYVLVMLPCIFTSTTCSSAAALVTRQEAAAATQRAMPIQQSLFGSF